MASRRRLLRKFSTSISDLLSLSATATNNKNCGGGGGVPSLSVAVQTGNLALAKAIVVATPHAVDEEDATGRSPLHHAVLLADVQMARMLVEAGASLDAVDYNDVTPAHLAAKEGMIDAMEVLISRGADLLAIDRAGRTPFDVAAEHGRGKMLDRLLSCGVARARWQQAGPAHRSSALHAAAREGHVHVVYQLLTCAQWEVNRLLPAVGTALHEAAVHGRVDVARLLLRAGADASIANAQGRTALDLVIAGNRGGTASKELVAVRDELVFFLSEHRSFVYAQAIDDWNGARADELVLSKGDVIWIVDRSGSERWRGVVFGQKGASRVGFVASDAVRIVDRPPLSVLVMPSSSTSSSSSSRGLYSQQPSHHHHQIAKTPRQVKRVELPHVPAAFAVDANARRSTNDLSTYTSCPGGSVRSSNGSEYGAPSGLLASGPVAASTRLSRCSLGPPTPSSSTSGSSGGGILAGLSSFTSLVAEQQRSRSTGLSQQPPPTPRPSTLLSHQPHNAILPGWAMMDDTNPPPGTSSSTSHQQSHQQQQQQQQQQRASTGSSTASSSGFESMKTGSSSGSTSASSSNCSFTPPGSSDDTGGHGSTPTQKSATLDDSGTDDPLVLDVTQMVVQGVPEAEIIALWLEAMGYSSFLSLFLTQGYDLASIARATPADLTALGVRSADHRRRLLGQIRQWQITDNWPRAIPLGGLREWLSLLGLPEYIALFERQGLRTVEEVCQLTWEDLEDVGVKRLGHLKRLGLATKKIADFRTGRVDTAASAGLAIVGAGGCTRIPMARVAPVPTTNSSQPARQQQQQQQQQKPVEPDYFVKGRTASPPPPAPGSSLGRPMQRIDYLSYSRPPTAGKSSAAGPPRPPQRSPNTACMYGSAYENQDNDDLETPSPQLQLISTSHILSVPRHGGSADNLSGLPPPPPPAPCDASVRLLQSGKASCSSSHDRLDSVPDGVTPLYSSAIRSRTAHSTPATARHVNFAAHAVDLETSHPVAEKAFHDINHLLKNLTDELDAAMLNPRKGVTSNL